MTTLTATAVRQNFFKVIEKVDKKSAPLTITINGLPKVVILPIEKYESWRETIEIMSDKKLMKDIRKAQRQIAKGQIISLDQLEQKYAMKNIKSKK